MPDILSRSVFRSSSVHGCTTAGDSSRDRSSAQHSSRGPAKGSRVLDGNRAQESGAAAAARDEHRARDNRMFGDSSLPERPSATAADGNLSSAAAAQEDAGRQAYGQVSAVSIGPASRVSTATLPATVLGNAKQKRKQQRQQQQEQQQQQPQQQQQQGTPSFSDDDGNGGGGAAANAHLESVPDVMQPLQGDWFLLQGSSFDRGPRACMHAW